MQPACCAPPLRLGSLACTACLVLSLSRCADTPICLLCSAKPYCTALYRTVPSLCRHPQASVGSLRDQPGHAAHLALSHAALVDISVLQSTLPPPPTHPLACAACLVCSQLCCADTLNCLLRCAKSTVLHYPWPCRYPQASARALRDQPGHAAHLALSHAVRQQRRGAMGRARVTHGTLLGTGARC